MKNRYSAAFAALLFLSGPAAQAQQPQHEENPLATLGWQHGPASGRIGAKAKIRIPEDYAFLDAAETKKFNELTQNISAGDEYVFAPASMQWFAVFRFSPVGYVKDDEKVDADAILASVRSGTAAANQERAKRGWPTMTVQGWRFTPQYDAQAKLLEWALLATDDATKQEVVNYNTRILGRTGVMSVIVVTSPRRLDESVADFKRVIGGYEYAPGEKYAEFKPGDHVAEIGLAALIAGGAAAVATKKGFWAVLGGFIAAAWKFLAAGAVALIAALRRLFRPKVQ